MKKSKHIKKKKKSKHNAFQGNSRSILNLGFRGGVGQKYSERLHRQGDILRCGVKAEVSQVEDRKVCWINRDKANDTPSETFLGLSHPKRLNKDDIPLLGSQDSPLLPEPSSGL